VAEFLTGNYQDLSLNQFANVGDWFLLYLMTFIFFRLCEVISNDYEN